MPKISVIVPVYNVEPYIHRCVDSILNQTFTDFELILVDDGSPDNCGAICDEYAAKDNRIIVIHKENGGLSDARNAGIDWAFANSDSEWITFIDSDDWAHKQYLEILKKTAVKNNSNICCCSFIRCDDQFSFNEEIVLIKDRILDPEDFFCQDVTTFTIACSKLYRIELFNGVRYPIGKLYEDSFITHELMFKQKSISLITNQLYAYYNNSSGIINSEWSIKKLDIISAQEKQIEFFAKTNHFRSLEYVLNRFLLKLAEALTEHEKELKESSEHLDKQYRKKMRYYLRHYRKYLHFSNKTWIYDVAYPTREKIRYIIKI